MLTNNPFAELSLVLPAVSMQVFVVLMVLLIIVGTGLDMLHKKNVVYFFRNANDANGSALPVEPAIVFRKRWSYLWRWACCQRIQSFPKKLPNESGDVHRKRSHESPLWI